MSDTIKVTIDLDPEVIKQQVAAGVVKLGVEEMLREGIASWAMTNWIESAARRKIMDLVGDYLEPVIQPIIARVLKEKMTEEWMTSAVEDFVEQKLSQ